MDVTALTSSHPLSSSIISSLPFRFSTSSSSGGCPPVCPCGCD